ncbi:MAG: aminotransferase, partial [Actinomycetota bacterium]|nr:aminotransferase [Actinomycetota bacterium]
MTHLDALSAAPLAPAVRAALLAALEEGWADPTRRYGSARRARLLL